MKRINIDKMDTGEVFIIKWKYNLLIGFDKSLADAMDQADSNQVRKLMVGFPDEMSAMNKYKTVPNWWNNLLVKLDLCPVLFI